MRNKGFAHTLNLHYGDDDIFVSEIANGRNTAVEVSGDSLVRLRQGNHPRLFTERVLRRFFTESFIRRRPRFLMPLSGWLQIVALAAGIAAAVTGLPDLLPAVVAAVMILAMFALDVWIWRAAMRALKSRTLLLTLPWFALTYPLRAVARRIRAKIGKQKKYTWD